MPGTTLSIADPGYVATCRERLDADGVLVLRGFLPRKVVDRVVAESSGREREAHYTRSTHNVYLTPADPELAPDHPFNRQVASSKGLLADDQIPADSPLRDVYADPTLRGFLCAVLGIDGIHPYDDDLSSINVHFAAAGQELGWHFDNSSFAVTMLLRAPDAGGVFEYVPDVRDADAGDMGFDRVGAVLDGTTPVATLDHAPGDLVLFRGRNALHRVTPTEGTTTRMLVVFAYNAEPDVGLSESALQTFYGRTA
ncbi:MAG: 2OG-Fe(II) oxygenase [Ilumatobacter sp.]|nr:2OG-Fe(II) oxygenase [Ilumatobacter sp.]